MNNYVGFEIIFIYYVTGNKLTLFNIQVNNKGNLLCVNIFFT